MRKKNIQIRGILGTPVQQGVKTVPTSVAQSNKLLQPGNEINSIYDKFINSIFDNQELSVDFKLLIWIMLHTGCRVSEALNLSSNDINSNWFVKIRGTKNSNDRIKLIPPFPFNYVKLKIPNIYLFSYMSRFYVYRKLRELGVYHKFGNNKNNSVTHLFRHIYASNLKEFGNKNGVASREIGHKSIKSINHYGNSKKR